MTASVEQLPAPQPTRIDPDASYSTDDLAAALRVERRSIYRWRQDKAMGFPRPFYIGRTPYWRGRVVTNWMENRQDASEKIRKPKR